jgi:hypothetical protein
MQFPKTAIAALGLTCLAGCSSTLDWREVRPEGGGIVAMFPCKPDQRARSVAVAGAKAPMHMLVCAAGGATYALSYLDVGTPAGVAAALADLRTVAAANLGEGEPRIAGLQVSGMTPNPQAAMLLMIGKLPDGAIVQEQAAFFVKGLRVYQASVIGAQLTAEAADTFFSGLKLSA